MPPTRFAGSKTINSAGQGVIATTSPLLMDGAITIGQLPLPLNNAVALVNATLTDNNAGQANAPDISINVAAGQTAVIPLYCSEYLKEVNSFLSTTSVPAINADGTLADNSGDTPVAKGTKITSFEFAYSVQGGALTSLNFRADLVTYKNAVANANTVLIANAATAAGNLAVTASATTCRVLTVPVIAPVFDSIDNTYVYLKISPVTPGGVTFRLYSVMMNITFNYL